MSEKTAAEIVKGAQGEAFDAHLESIERDDHFRGAVLIEKRGEPILCKGYGLATSSSQNRPSTIFQIGSITKQFTAAALLKLYESGKVDLEAPINPYLIGQYGLNEKDLKNWKDVKVRHLLSHTSGITNYTEWDDYFSISKGLTLKRLLHYAIEDDLNFKPGKQFEYSNTGYILLGIIIEKLSGVSYGEYVTENLLMPAGMDSSGVYDEDYKPKRNAAVGYCLDKNGENLVEDHSENIAATFSDGSIYSTVEDLSKWSQALDGKNKVLSKEIIALMTKPGLGGYGYGLEIDKIFGKKLIHHNGSIAGFKCDFCKFPDEDIFLTVLGNNLDFEVEHITGNFSRFLFGSEKDLPVSIPYPKDFDFSLFEGVFRSDEGKDEDTEFYVKKGRLFVDGEPPGACLLLSNGRLFNPVFGVEFELKKNGKMIVYNCDGNEIDSLYRLS